MYCDQLNNPSIFVIDRLLLNASWPEFWALSCFDMYQQKNPLQSVLKHLLLYKRYGIPNIFHMSFFHGGLKKPNCVCSVDVVRSYIKKTHKITYFCFSVYRRLNKLFSKKLATLSYRKRMEWLTLFPPPGIFRTNSYKDTTYSPLISTQIWGHRGFFPRKYYGWVIPLVSMRG